MLNFKIRVFSSTNEKIVKFQKLVKLYEKKIGDFGTRKTQLKDTLKLKEMRIQDLERENNELQAKLSSKSIFSSMEVNYGQLISLQKENSELKTQLSILEVWIKLLKLKNYSWFCRKNFNSQKRNSHNLKEMKQMGIQIKNKGLIDLKDSKIILLSNYH